ncbi:tetratricopeptide repeat protein [Paracoccaceae bacterium]|nr:tetratricopeptide repeat protein [Paracoccaceae bacterium]
MELTIDQALQKGIKAHKAGQVQEADRLYTAILKAQPKHPDANHNMGVLAVGVGKVQEALPFFKTALKTNPSIEQFWLSYIDALIKVDRLADAKEALYQALKNGAKVDQFFGLEQQLDGVEPSKTAVSKSQDPPQEKLHSIINRYSQGQLQQALDETSQLLQQFPRSVILNNISGAANAGLGYLDAALENYKQAISIEPNYAEAYYNMGIALQEQGKLDEAIEAYNKALAIKPDYADAYNNMGIALKAQGKLDQAIEAYNKALAIKPDYADAYYNIGNALKDQDKLREAIEAFKKDGSKKSQISLLKCFYGRDEQINFYDRLDYLINQDENNAVIGSYISRSQIRYGIYRANPFCNDPLKYVLHTNLINRCDFENIFVRGASHILSNEIVQIRSQSLLTNGIQTTGNIFNQIGAFADKIENILRSEIEKYQISFKESQEGFIKNWPSNYELHGWLVSMKSGGKLAAHMHDKGWISGSIYINVPPKVNQDSGNFVVCLDSERDSQSIDVGTGSLCLFPSSLLHYTIPFEADESRVVLAFDMIPKS